MTEDKEIREAIEICKQDMKHNPFTPDLQKGYKTLLALAERYLAVDGFPEKKKDTNKTYSSEAEELHSYGYDRGYNQAIEDCRLSLVKKCEGLEELCILYANHPYQLSTAIREHLEG